MGATSIHVQAVKPGSEIHNFREKEFDTKEDAEEHLAQKKWEDILTATLIFFTHVKSQMENTQKE